MFFVEKKNQGESLHKLVYSVNQAARSIAKDPSKKEFRANGY